MMKLTTISFGAILIASGLLDSRAADLKLETALPLTAASSDPSITFDLSIVGTPDNVDLEQAYTAAVKYQQSIRKERLLLLAHLAIQKQHAEALVLADKTLVKREEEKLELDTAMPEASPSTSPFSSSRPESIVSNVSTQLYLTAPFEMNNLAATPEPPTWALFGLGAALLIFVVPGRGKKNNPKL